MTPHRSAILGFPGRFAVIYALLIIPWPGWNAAYDSYFQSLGRAVFSGDGSRRVIVFQPHHDTVHPLGTQLSISNRDLLNRKGEAPVTSINLDTRGIGWVPTALTCALILATPVPWKRRGWALLWGLFWIHLFILFSIEVWIGDVSTGLSLATLTPFWQQVADGLVYTLITQMGASFSVPVLIWILVTFRRQDAMALSKVLSGQFDPGHKHHDRKHLSEG